MKNVIAKLIYFLLTLEIIILLICGFLAYFATSFDKISKTWFDGLGRTLEPAPFLIRFIYMDDLWPGLKWFIFDIFIFWGAVLLGYSLINLSRRLEIKG